MPHSFCSGFSSRKAGQKFILCSRVHDGVDGVKIRYHDGPCGPDFADILADILADLGVLSGNQAPFRLIYLCPSNDDYLATTRY